MGKDISRIFKEAEIDSIAKIIGDTNMGLTGSQIGHLLKSEGIKDVDPGLTKWKRLFNELVDAAFGGANPILKINSFVTDTEKSEQRGFTNLLKGLFGTFRNPAAHALRIEWNMEEIDALDLFSLVSYAFRRIDSSIKST